MRKIYLLGALSGALLATSCDNSKDVVEPEDQVTQQQVVNHYAELVYATYVDAHSQAVTLKAKIDALIARPSETTLEAAKQAWLAAREPYGQSEAFRFYGGPIDDEDGPEGQLNAWPLDESYIDYVDGSVNGGGENASVNIIGDEASFPTIDKALIASLNEDGGETNITAGYHALEFLLWGQDVSAGPGGGERSYTDYETGLLCTNGHCDRRGDYLQAATELLLDDLQMLLDQWQPGGAYRTAFTASDAVDSSLEKMLIGMGKLSKGELAGERMFVAWDEKSKEDEHSCFSDNTHRDIVTNEKGIVNVYTGRYVWSDGTVLEGPSLAQLVQQDDSDLHESLMSTMNAAMTATQAIQPPFDQEILTEAGRVRVKNAIDLLREQGDKIAEVSALYGFALDPSDLE
ncbi:putative iron-regulated protein [Catalinimonas alkaloidigena]|uniref:Putative iron-regulated protein n=1 Tax=Catalinimonas alkaloidigena TaxID=1075417 RepID=A0A1G9JJF2_9BACT|nr:imelysin family protein [Catalinimonas alkaloidigena]SDL37213.1 putative iron-regulated protein [Catalinimonas alkaloidigena]